MLFQETLYVSWIDIAIHMTLVFASILSIIFIIYKSKKINWRSLTGVILLLTIIILLAPEYYIKYVCCSIDSERLILSVLFFIELFACVSEIVYLIHLRNEKLRKKYGVKG